MSNQRITICLHALNLYVAAAVYDGHRGQRNMGGSYGQMQAFGGGCYEYVRLGARAPNELWRYRHDQAEGAHTW